MLLELLSLTVCVPCLVTSFVISPFLPSLVGSLTCLFNILYLLNISLFPSSCLHSNLPHSPPSSLPFPSLTFFLHSLSHFLSLFLAHSIPTFLPPSLLPSLHLLPFFLPPCLPSPPSSLSPSLLPTFLPSSFLPFLPFFFYGEKPFKI